jgi:hypothetical protein
MDTAEFDGSSGAVIDHRFGPELLAIREKFAPLIAFIEAKAPRVTGQPAPV